MESLNAAGADDKLFDQNRIAFYGKGQIKVNSDEELHAAWATLEQQSCVLEAFVPFERIA